MGDLDNEDFGASIAISPDEWYDSEGDIDESLETEGSIFITTLDLDDDIFNTWKFGESGNLVFPGGTLFGAGEVGNTIGFEIEDDSDFFILTGDEEFEWVFKNDGELMFPDGTLFGEVGASGTIGFVTEEDSDFSIATSSSNNDYEWQFTKDGVFKLPGLTGSASFRVINDAPFFSPVALQITSPNAFQLKSQSTGKTWNLESNGNTVFPADFAIEGDLKIKRGGVYENIFDMVMEMILDYDNGNFEQKTITLTNSGDIDGFNENGFKAYTLDETPRSIDQVAMFVNGVRVDRNTYTVNGRSVTYNKNVTSYSGSVIIRFDYFIN
jgi:hypothetical protein